MVRIYPRRKPPTPEVEQRLRCFYRGKTCVATGQTESIDWHHLNEKAWQSSFENLVPLRADLNRSIEDHRRDPETALLFPLRTAALDDLSQVHFDTGMHERGYACARVGAFISARHNRDPDNALRFCANALVHLRTVAELALARAVVRSMLRILTGGLAKESVAFHTRALVCLEVGSFFEDYGDLADAYEWFLLGQRILSRELDIPRVKMTESRLLLKRGVAHLAIGDAKGSLKLLQMARQSVPIGIYPFGNSNNALWVLRAATKAGRFEKAEEILLDSEQRFGELDAAMNWSPGQRLGKRSIWTHIETLASAADAENGMGHTQRRTELAAEAHTLSRLARIVPTAILPSTALKIYQRDYISSAADLLHERNPNDLAGFRIIASKLLQVLRATTDWRRTR